MKSLSIIIPTYNERLNIVSLINQINDILSKENLLFEILIIDDNSPDQTSDLVNKTFNKKKIKSYKRKGKRGLVRSLKYGVGKSQGEILVFMDGDFSHPPEVILDLISNLDTYDLTLASRYIEGGVDGRNHVNFHRFLSRVISFLYKFFTGLPVKDITSGFFAISRTSLTQLNGDYGEYFIDLVSVLSRRGSKILEVPYINKNRRHGVSKSGKNPLELILRGIPYLIMILKHSKYLRLPFVR